MPSKRSLTSKKRSLREIERIRDFLFAEVGLREGLFGEDAISKGLTVLDEMSQFGIETPLGTVLADRKLIQRGTIRAITQVLSKVEIGTTCCRKRISMDKLSKEGRVRCPDCNKLVTIELREGVSARPGASKNLDLAQMIRAVSQGIGSAAADTGHYSGGRARPLVPEPRTGRAKKKSSTRSESRADETDSRITDLSALVGKIHAVSPTGSEARKHIRNYRCRRLLSHGPRGHIYLARRAEKKASAPVALKLYELRRGGDQSWLATVREQLEAWSNFSTSGQNPRHEFHVEKGIAYIIRSFLGNDYRDLTGLGSLRSDERVKLLREVVVQMAEAHQAGLVHGNLKPSNIFFRRKDFSFEIAIVDPLLAPTAKPRDLERWNMVARSPQYRSPEEIDGQNPTAASDVYALGWVIYSVLAGKPPFDSLPSEEVLSRHRHGPIPSLSDRYGPWKQLVIAATAVDPGERIGDATELLAHIETLVKGGRPRLPRITSRSPAAPSKPETELETSRPRKKPRTNRLRAFVACLLLLGAGLWTGDRLRRWKETRAMLSSHNRTTELYHRLAGDAFAEAKTQAGRDPDQGWLVWNAFLKVYGDSPLEGAARAEQRHFAKPNR